MPSNTWRAFIIRLFGALEIRIASRGIQIHPVFQVKTVAAFGMLSLRCFCESMKLRSQNIIRCKFSFWPVLPSIRAT